MCSMAREAEVGCAGPDTGLGSSDAVCSSHSVAPPAAAEEWSMGETLVVALVMHGHVRPDFSKLKEGEERRVTWRDAVRLGEISKLCGATAESATFWQKQYAELTELRRC